MFDVTTLMSRPRIHIRGGVVLSQDRAVGDFANGDVLIEDGKIRDVGPNISASDAAVISAGAQLAVAKGVTLFASTDGEFTKRGNTYTLNGGVRFSW